MPEYTGFGEMLMGFHTEVPTRTGGIARLIIWADTQEQATDLLQATQTADGKEPEYEFPLDIDPSLAGPMTPVCEEQQKHRVILSTARISLQGYSNPPHMTT